MSALLEFVERYGPKAGELGPETLAQEVFGIELDNWQRRIFRAFGRGERRISLRSCHGPGKTFVAAVLVWVQLLTRFPQKTIATAPTKAQIEDALFSEVLRWGKKLPPTLRELYEFKTTRIELKAAPEESFFAARTSRAEAPEALQGVHSDHVLLIADEASGIPEAIFEAASGSMSGLHATTLLLGNPVRTSGLFFDTHHKLKDMWFTLHIGHADSARVTDDFVADIARRYGEDSNAFRIRCLGEFPKSDDDTIIPYELIEGAIKRDITTDFNVAEVWGLDVARTGSDLNVLCRRKGRVVLEVDSWRSNDLMVTTGRVKALWDKLQPTERPVEILVDVIGLGAGVLDRLRELKLPARGINVGEAAAANDQYANLRTELWFKGRGWLAQRNCRLPDHEGLSMELSVLKFKYRSSGKMIAETKEELKKRGFKSPNHADAFLLTLAGDAITMMSGSSESTAWTKPLKRGVQGIV